ncbi:MULTISPECIES: hypothetical protein [Burkholderia]|uniref:Uncharacterized protein n=1 Tax=Burkholderia paludis TaxID=1506587 RepID=A0A6J5DB80_9BURK|nr:MULTISPECIES: hypothetical protein [Burkholderia]CAB3750657.1 hypothetical protein LMG30113_01259 [Burkholderia paludis]VWB11060.1 hypothetical protein BPA30113_00218 [Burkholderia paludis]
MINIQDSRVIKYDNDRKSVTVYRDFANANLWYIVPRPQLATQTVDGVTLPAFALTEFRTNSGSAGTVTFTAELVIDPEAYQAVKSVLGQGIEFGQFVWNDAQAFLTLTLPSTQRDTQINVTPSNFGSNAATFIIDLKTADDVKAIRDIFNTGVGLSTWSIQYVATTLSQLPAVKATVTYDCTIAASYQKTVQIDRNVWGSETGRRTTIREYMQKSDSGKVNLEWAVQPSDEFRQRVHDWAFTTLEGLVQAAADDVARRLGASAADDFSINSIGSFQRIYQENEVIDWTIQPQGFLPTFDKDVWSRLDKTVDNRTLNVAVTMSADLKGAGVKKVTLTIDYPAKAQPESHTFTVDQNSPWTYESNGFFDADKKFVSEYTYWYQVESEKGESFPSPKFKASATQLQVSSTDLGYQKVEFICSNIAFASGKAGYTVGAPANNVDFVLIDFTYLPTAGGQLFVDQRKVSKNGETVRFTSHSFQPIGAAYSYAITYVLTNGDIIVNRPQSVYPTVNSTTQTIYSMIGPADFTVTVTNDTIRGGSIALPAITGIALTTDYTDQPDSPDHQTYSFHDLRIEADYSDTWEYQAVKRSTSTVQVDGTVYYRDKNNTRKSVAIRKVRYGNQPSFALDVFPVQLPFTVTFDPSLVDWKAYVQVEVKVYRKSAFGQTDIDSSIFKPATLADGTTVPPSPYYYTFSREVDASTEFHYETTYFEASTKRGVPGPQGNYENNTVILPHDATGGKKTAYAVRLPASDIVTRTLDVTDEADETDLA